MNSLKQLWSNLRSSLWFVPVLMLIASAVLALLLIEVDGRTNRELLAEYPRIFGAGADGSRGMLSAIAGSMITVAGLTFSLTVVAMAQASSQYTSRILRNFMRDRSNQFVLGFFVGIFAYCLIVLRTIRGGDEGRFIPSLAVLCGLLLAITSVGVLIFFIHHIANSIQASSIISSAAKETIRTVERLFPHKAEEFDDAQGERTEALFATRLWQPIPSTWTGYVQTVNTDGLVAFAMEHHCLIQMERGLGSFVVKGSPLVSIAATGADNYEVGEETTENLNELFTGKHYLGLFVAAVIIFPAFKPGDLITGLGITSVAIGFAFKDVLQNFFAGVLILWRRPFLVGDQIRTREYEGTVEEITVRSTRLKTYDGERAVLPNGDVYTNAILVRTAYAKRRVKFTVGIGYPDSIEKARTIIKTVLKKTEGVLVDPEAWVYVTELAPSSVNFIVYFWVQSEQARVLEVSDRVATGIKLALDDAKIDMPFPHTVVLFHDTTGTRDGDISRAEYLQRFDKGESIASNSRGTANINSG